MTSCGTRFVGPEGEVLYQVQQTPAELQLGLETLSFDGVRGPSHHGSVMFRRSAYQQVGGYRILFPVAQDLDLWLRMAEIGACHAAPAVGYVATLNHGAISIARRDEQLRATRVILAAAALRRSGADERIALDRWREVRPRRARRSQLLRAIDQARLHYFIGSCLRTHEPAKASEHFRRALRCFVLYPRAWYGLLRTWGRA